MAHPLQSRPPTDAEIIALAALEGHDADIPTNLGSVHCAPSTTSTRPPSLITEKDIKAAALERDLEKALSLVLSSVDGDADEGAQQDPNIVDFDGPDDPASTELGLHEEMGYGAVDLGHHLPDAACEFHVCPRCPRGDAGFWSTNDMLSGFMVSVYVLGFS